AVLALERGIVPATLGTRSVDPELPACRVARRSQRVTAPSVLLLSESFGGRTAALLIGAAAR
ncbi:MAG: beta-ketoacyl-[acyl-carrier-protein] synthase family protein, partial [Gemmatimonadota bacterium]